MFKNFSSILSDSSSRKTFAVSVCFSALYFAATFILTSYSSHAWSTANAWAFEYRPLFSLDGMQSLMDTKDWNPQKIAQVFLAPPLWGLFLSVVSLLAYYWVDLKHGQIRLFLFWLSLNGFILYYSNLISGLLSYQVYTSKFFTGFVSYYAWLFWGKHQINLTLILQGILSLPYAVLYSKLILQQNHFRRLASGNSARRDIFVSVILVPFVLGVSLVLMASFPMDIKFQLVKFLSFFPVFLVMYIGLFIYAPQQIYVVKRKLIANAFLWVLMASLVLIVISRVVLSIKIGPLWHY
ncbi:hypothetical protein ACFLR1_06110 [Bacteroidota bacterium]